MTAETKSGLRTVACSVTSEQHALLTKEASNRGLRSVGSLMRTLLEETIERMQKANAKAPAAKKAAPAAKATKARAKPASPTSK